MNNIHSAAKCSVVLTTFLALMTVSNLGRAADMLQVGNAKLFYETAGQGTPVVFVHAGVADSRQWNHQFASFAEKHRVIRYDMRGYGKSLPVVGEYSHLDDLTRLVEHLNIVEPMILVGCSMGGATALDFALQDPEKVRALVLVDSAPSGLQLDVPTPPKFRLVEEAEKTGNLELVSELETQIWFDGDRPADKVDQGMRQLAYEMNLIALQNGARALGTRLPNSKTPAIDRLAEIMIPVLAVVGENDIPYMLAAVNVMGEKIADYRTVRIANAAHLPNMDQPIEFEKVLEDFIRSVTH